MKFLMIAILSISTFTAFAQNLEKEDESNCPQDRDFELKDIQFLKTTSPLEFKKGQSRLNFWNGELVSGFSSSEVTCEINLKNDVNKTSIIPTGTQIVVIDSVEGDHEGSKYVTIKLKLGKFNFTEVYCQNYKSVSDIENALKKRISIEL